MKRIEDIAKQWILEGHSSSNSVSRTLCRCIAEHYICLNCTVCRANEPNVTDGLLIESGFQSSGYFIDESKLLKQQNKSQLLIPQSFTRFIDHTLLKPDAVITEIESLCAEAIQFSFAAVCVNPYFVTDCAKILNSTRVKVCTVAGFPLGANRTEVKVTEVERAIVDGADEIDMVINLSSLKQRNISYLYEEITALTALCLQNNILLKGIIETCLLTDEEKVIAALILKKGGAHYVKTSTGFSSGGAKTEDVSLLRRVVGSKMGVKASGGISTPEQIDAMLNAGATRIGSSRSVKRL